MKVTLEEVQRAMAIYKELCATSLLAVAFSAPKTLAVQPLEQLAKSKKLTVYVAALEQGQSPEDAAAIAIMDYIIDKDIAENGIDEHEVHAKMEEANEKHSADEHIADTKDWLSSSASDT